MSAVKTGPRSQGKALVFLSVPHLAVRLPHEVLVGWRKKPDLSVLPDLAASQNEMPHGGYQISQHLPSL